MLKCKGGGSDPKGKAAPQVEVSPPREEGDGLSGSDSGLMGHSPRHIDKVCWAVSRTGFSDIVGKRARRATKRLKCRRHAHRQHAGLTSGLSVAQ